MENVKIFHFPNYEKYSSYFVREYLKGNYGVNPMDINPEAGGMFYALDRYDTYQKEIKEYYEKGYIIILDRYTMSNIYQMAKKKTQQEKDDYWKWNVKLEHEILGLPYPDIILYLNTPYEVAYKIMSAKQEADIHETFKEYQQEVHKTILDLCSKTDNAYTVDNTINGNIKSRDEIFKDILNVLYESNVFKEKQYLAGLILQKATLMQMEQYNNPQSKIDNMILDNINTR
jgi:dTMP kinase